MQIAKSSIDCLFVFHKLFWVCMWWCVCVCVCVCVCGVVWCLCVCVVWRNKLSQGESAASITPGLHTPGTGRGWAAAEGIASVPPWRLITAHITLTHTHTQTNLHKTVPPPLLLLPLLRLIRIQPPPHRQPCRFVRKRD